MLGPILFHVRLDGLSGDPLLAGGFFTIDVFFVLSAYLITSIALAEHAQTGRLDLRAYAGRRARRLLPALGVVLVGLTAWLVVVADPALVPRWTGAIVSALTYTANWYEITVDVSYFEQFADPSPLTHVWSLAIEEQFYVVLPFIVLGALAVGRRQWALPVVAGGAAVASALWMARLFEPGLDSSRVYYGTDTRAQGLLIGIALAAAVRAVGEPGSERARRVAVMAVWPAMTFLVWMVVAVDQGDGWVFDRGGFLAVGVAAAVVVHGLCVGAPADPLHRLMGLRPLRYLGRITYGLYLYHWPIFLLATPVRVGRLVPGVDVVEGWLLVGVHLAATLAVAAASYRWVERPFMERRARVRPVVAGVVVVALVVGGLMVADGRRSDAVGTNPCAVQGVPDPPGGPELRVLVVGDSEALLLGEALCQWGLDHPGRLTVLNETGLGCQVGRGGLKRTAEGEVFPVEDCSVWAEAVSVAEMHDPDVVSWPTAVGWFLPDVVVGHVSSWDAADRRVPMLGSDWTHVGDPRYDDWLWSEYRLASTILTSGGAPLVWLEGAHQNRPVQPQNHPDRIDAVNAIVAEVAAGLDGVSTAPYAEFIGPVGGERDLQLRPDGIHVDEASLADAGAWLMTRIVLPATR